MTKIMCWCLIRISSITKKSLNCLWSKLQEDRLQRRQKKNANNQIMNTLLIWTKNKRKCTCSKKKWGINLKQFFLKDWYLFSLIRKDGQELILLCLEWSALKYRISGFSLSKSLWSIRVYKKSSIQSNKLMTSISWFSFCKEIFTIMKVWFTLLIFWDYKVGSQSQLTFWKDVFMLSSLHLHLTFSLWKENKVNCQKI